MCEGGGQDKWPLLLETLQEFTMLFVTACRCLDLFVVLSMLFPFIHANRIITDRPDHQKSTTTTGKHTEHEFSVLEGNLSKRDLEG